MRYFFLALLLLPVAVLANDDPFAGMESMTQIEGRYVIGPWQGALVGGENCQLLNTETLGGVEWSISAAHGSRYISIQLGADFLHDPSLPDRDRRIKEVTLQLDQADSVKISFGTSRFGLFYNATPEMITALRSARFATYRIGTGSVSFDLRGFDRAYRYFEQCRARQLPDNLPQEPLEEGAPRSIAGAPNWQIVDLMFEGQPYQRLATLSGNADYPLVLWVHNRAQYVLNVTAMKELPSFRAPYAAILKLDGATEIKTSFILQADGILISLPLAQLRQVAKARQLEVMVTGLKVSYDISGFAAVAQAIQFTE